MDPNLFHIEWDQLAEVLTAVVVLSFFVERTLALLFENRWYVGRYGKAAIKEPIAFLFALLVCTSWHFDAVAVLLRSTSTTFFGELVTAGIVAGGSKASIKLFHDVLDVKNVTSVAPDPKPDAD